MTMKTDKEILEEISTSRNYAPHTKTTYNTVIKNYTEFFGMSMHSLIKEAEEEEELGIRWKHRKLKKRLMEYRQYCLDKYLISTARGNMMRIKSVYKYYEIEIHSLPYVSDKQVNQSVPLTYNDLPTKEIISQAVQLSDPLLKAVILFISSSGTGRAEALNLTIKDFVESVQEYTYETDIYKVIYELHSRDDIVPMFKLKRQKINEYYYTFCSPEATISIMDYLLTRKEQLTPDKRLFKIDKKYLSDKMGMLNDQLGLGKKAGFNRLRCHMLRKYHATNLSNGDNSLTETDIDFLQGRSDKKTRQSYFFTDENKLKVKYAESMNDVTIFNQYNVFVDTENNILVEVYDPKDEVVPLQEKVVQLGKENNMLRVENKQIREEMKAEARKVFEELLRENNISL